MLDCVVLTTNLDSHCWQPFPFVAQAWRKFYGVPVHLAVVGEASRRVEFTGLFAGANAVTWLEPVKNMPDREQLALAAHYVAARLPAKVRLVTAGMNYLPLTPNVVWAPITAQALAEMAPASTYGWGEFIAASATAAHLTPFGDHVNGELRLDGVVVDRALLVDEVRAGKHAAAILPQPLLRHWPSIYPIYAAAFPDDL